MIKIVPDPPHNLEQTLLRISDMLRCASAIAYEFADQLGRPKRDLALAVVYLFDMARSLVDQSLDQVEKGGRAL